jgi:hypothetical protein
MLHAAATRLSGSSGLASRAGRAFLGLARLSLVGAGVFMSSGCLIDDPPPYTQPKRTPVRIDARFTEPPLTEVLVVKTGGQVKFTLPFASEDAGEPLTAVFLLDYTGDPSRLDKPTFQDLAASTLDDTNRSIDLTWAVRGNLDGCHRITVRVSHNDNFSQGAYPELIDKKDSAEAYWLVVVNPPSDKPISLSDCPLASTVVQP